MVYLNEFIDKKRVTFLSGGSKMDVLERLIEASRDGDNITDYERFRQAVLEREEIVSTGIGQGVALPHVKCPYVSRFFITVGIVPKGVDWDSLDGKPVRLVFLIGGPENHHHYLQILAKLTLLIRNEERREALIGAADADAVLRQFENL